MKAFHVLALASVVVLLGGQAHAAEKKVSGSMTVTSDLRVGKGDTLRLGPGARLLFKEGASLSVEGALVAEGSPGKPVRFGPEKKGGRWAGIRATTGASVSLSGAVIRGADDAVRMTGGRLTVGSAVIEDCVKGVVLEKMAVASAAGLKTRGMKKSAFSVKQDSGATLTGCAFSGPGDGVSVTGKCSVVVKGCEFSGLEHGLRAAYPGAEPEVADCVFTSNKYGVYSEYPEAVPVVKRCRFSRNTYGVYSRKLSSPRVEGCEIKGNEYGVYATEGSSVAVEGCRINGNKYAVYVTFSSYPRINGSDLSGNTGYAAYLDEQSYDWVRSNGADVRRREMGMRAAAGNGGAGARERGQSASRYVNPNGGFVDFTGNFWGAGPTAEMEKNGGLGDVGAIYDYFDLNDGLYDGKKWARDKVDYSGYLKKSPVD